MLRTVAAMNRQGRDGGHGRSSKLVAPKAPGREVGFAQKSEQRPDEREDGPAERQGDVASQVHIGELQIAGDPARVREWLGVDQTFHKGDIHFAFVAPHGTPGLLSVTFETPDGPVTI